MPDLDDLFEDAFDAVKKQVRKRRKQQKKAKKRRAKQARHSMPDAQVPAPVEHRRAGEAAAGPYVDAPSVSRAPANVGPLQWMRMRLNGPVVQDPRLREQLAQADAYAAGVKRLAGSARNQFNRARMTDLLNQTEHWQQSLRALVTRVDDYRHNHLLQRDLATLPQAIHRLESELAESSSPRVAGELERTLENRHRQLDALKSLETTMRAAEVKIESTVSVLGALYSQAHASQAKGQVADFRRVLTDIEEEARTLDDYVAVLADVKGL